MRFGSRNPVFGRIEKANYFENTNEVATYKGITKKTLYFLGMVLLGTMISILLVISESSALLPIMVVSGIGTFIFGIVALVSPKNSKVFGTLYCVSEGILVGLISLVYALAYNGIITAALLSVFTIFLVVVTLYLTGIVRVTNKFINFLFIFSIAYILSMLVIWIFFAISGNTFSVGTMALISGITVFIATLYLFFDLEQIRRVVEGGYPKQMEWYAAFGLAYTLVWLYIEVLRLISIFMDRD